MSDQTRRVWRAGTPGLVLVGLFAALAGIAIPVLAYLIYRSEGTPWISVLLIALTVLALVYAWRFGLHPRLVASDRGVEVINPLRRTTLEWDDITVIAPGENGLVVASAEQRAEAWCVQKASRAIRRGEVTRADLIAHQLLDILDLFDPPLEDEQTGLRIRRARFDESRLLTQLERGASEAALAHLFPAGEHAFPTAEIQRRWRRLLRDGRSHVHILQLKDEPVGYVAFGDGWLQHLGVLAEHTRRGYGSALLEFATLELFSGADREASLWVLTGNEAARAFYRAHRWVETDERRRSEYPPHPEAIRMVRKNPAAPRRSR
jgi:ribosomal protein S18 acetylase RimI-like enzyme